jgi:hypothetical protein
MLTNSQIKFLADMNFAAKNGTHVSKSDLKQLQDIAFNIDCIADAVTRNNQELKATSELGEEAMKYIADYPLYASTCGVTYEDAIKVAEALSKNWQDEVVEMARFEKLSPMEQLAELKLGAKQ